MGRSEDCHRVYSSSQYRGSFLRHDLLILVLLTYCEMDIVWSALLWLSAFWRLAHQKYLMLLLFLIYFCASRGKPRSILNQIRRTCDIRIIAHVPAGSQCYATCIRRICSFRFTSELRYLRMSPWAVKYLWLIQSVCEFVLVLFLILNISTVKYWFLPKGGRWLKCLLIIAIIMLRREFVFWLYCTDRRGVERVVWIMSNFRAAKLSK